MNTMAQFSHDDYFIWVGPLGALFQSFLNTILIYRVGVMIYGDKSMAELAAYLYIASHSVLYQITFYSENSFLLLTLIGLYVLYSGASKQENRALWNTPRDSTALLACFFFGMSTLTRSTGVLLSIFIAFFLGNKILDNIFKPSKSIRTVVTALVCILIMFAPLVVVVYWKPTILHCGLRKERDWQGEHPFWCSERIPNVYTYIQLKYWQNRFLGFLYRGIENILTAIPTNVVYIAVTARLAKAQPLAFMSLGIFGKEKKRKDGSAVLDGL